MRTASRKVVPAAVALAASLSLVLVSFAQQNNIPPPVANCAPFGGVPPSGQQYPTAIEPDQPIWCYSQPQAGDATRLAGVNDWMDSWDNNGPSIQTLNSGDYDYRRFNFTQREAGQDRVVSGGFINVNHWMLDIGDISPYRLSGGVQLSPNKSFVSENGKLVVEADMAAGSDGMGGADAYYEIDVTPAQAPTGITVDPLYGYGQFGGIPSVGCRFERAEDGGHVVCAAYDNTKRDAGGTCVDQDANFQPRCTLNGPGRIWEAQGAGTAYTAQSVQGGYPGFQAIGSTLHSSDFWRICADSTAPTPNSLDLYCRDRMRIEFTRDSIDIYVNAGHVYSITGLYAQNPHNGADNRLNFINNQTPLYVYYTSWINSGIHHATRWHWDWLAVNPHQPDGTFRPPSTNPNYCYGRQYNTCPPGDVGPIPTPSVTSVPATSTPVPAGPTSTPLPTSTAIPTTTAIPTSTILPTVVPTATVVPTTTPGEYTCEVQVTIDGFQREPVPC